jgi:Four helix bundle sensory module for signal transduction
MDYLKSKIIKHKLALSFLLIILLFLSFGIMTIRGLFTLSNFTRTIYDHPLVVSNASLIAGFNITKMHSGMKDVVLANSSDEVEIALKSVDENEYIVYQQLDVVRENIIGEKGQALEKQTRKLFENWKPIREEVVRFLKSGNKNDAILITKAKGAEHVVKLETKMLELTSYAREKAKSFLEVAEASRSRLENITVILTLSGVFLCVIIAFISTSLIVKAEKKLQDEKNKLKKALDEIKTLRGIIQICSHCKQIRDDKGLWKQIEEYIHAHSEAEFSHSICPECMKRNYPEEYASMYSKKNKE